MSPNEQLIDRFYSAFKRLDANGMNACYADDIIFHDPVFLLLRGEEVRNMWRMLCERAKDFSLEYSDIKAVDEEYYTCNWVAKYSFSATGRKVTNITWKNRAPPHSQYLPCQKPKEAFAG